MQPSEASDWSAWIMPFVVGAFILKNYVESGSRWILGDDSLESKAIQVNVIIRLAGEALRSNCHMLKGGHGTDLS